MRTSLPCPKCNAEYTPIELLDYSTISWPELNWIYFECKKCKSMTHVRIFDGRIQTIDFIGAPGPEYKVHLTMPVPELSVRMDPSFAHAWLGSKHYEFPAKE